MATRDLGQRNWTAAGGRVFRKALPWLGGVSVAILISMQATAWAHATMRAWFIATLSHGFGSAMSMDQTHPNLARSCEDTPYVRAKQTPTDDQQHLAMVSTDPLERRDTAERIAATDAGSSASLTPPSAAKRSELSR